MANKLVLKLTAAGMAAIISFNMSSPGAKYSAEERKGGKKGPKPLGERSDEDKLDFAIMARESGRPDYIGLFENLPPLSELQAARADSGVDKALGSAPNLPSGPLGATAPAKDEKQA